MNSEDKSLSSGFDEQGIIKRILAKLQSAYFSPGRLRDTPYDAREKMFASKSEIKCHKLQERTFSR